MKERSIKEEISGRKSSPWEKNRALQKTENAPASKGITTIIIICHEAGEIKKNGEKEGPVPSSI